MQSSPWLWPNRLVRTFHYKVLLTIISVHWFFRVGLQCLINVFPGHIHFYINPYTPSLLFVGHRQTVQNQIRCCKTWHLIRFSTICLKNVLLKFVKTKNTTQQPLKWKWTGSTDKIWKLQNILGDTNWPKSYGSVQCTQKGQILMAVYNAFRIAKYL